MVYFTKLLERFNGTLCVTEAPIPSTDSGLTSQAFGYLFCLIFLPEKIC